MINLVIARSPQATEAISNSHPEFISGSTTTKGTGSRLGGRDDAWPRSPRANFVLALAMTLFLAITPLSPLHAASKTAPSEPKPAYTINWMPVNSALDWLAAIPGRVLNKIDNWGQRWVVIFTRDPFAKAERSLNAANGKLQQTTAAVRQADNPATLGLLLLRSLERYTAFTDVAVERIKELARKDPTLEYQQLLENYSVQQLKDQQALRLLVDEAGEINSGVIVQAKEKALAQFAEILSELDPQEITRLLKNSTLSQTDVADLLAALDTVSEVKQKIAPTLRASVTIVQREIVQRLLKEATTSGNTLLKKELPRLQKLLNDLR